MKKKIAYISTLAIVSVGCFFIGRNTVETEIVEKTEVVNQVMNIDDVIELINRFTDKEYINIYDVNGWECWDKDGIGYLEIEDWVISKKHYALDASYRKIE